MQRNAETDSVIEAAEQSVQLLSEPGALSIEAAGGGEGKLPTFRMVAYTGDAMRLAYWQYPVVADLAGITIPSQSLPVRFQHDTSAGVGHTTRIAIEDGKLMAEGVVSRDTEQAREVVSSAKKGFPWQASMLASVLQREFIPEDQSVLVNGREFKGPVYVARKAVLAEISFVDLGADRNTSVKVAAKSKETSMKKGKNQESESQAQETPQDEGQVRAAATADPVTPAPTAAAKPTEKIEASDAGDFVKDLRAKAAAEHERIVKVGEVCGQDHPDIAAKAIAEGWDVTRTELEVMRAERPKAPNAIIPDQKLTDEVLAAAVCMAGGIRAEGCGFSDQTLEAADKRFRRGIGLQELLLEAAWANGYQGRSFRADMDGTLRAAFSTFRLPGILSNIANKFLLEGFEGVESTWRRICSVRNVRDFKTVTSYRLTGAFEYEEVGPTGELKHGQIGEDSFTNQAKTYGKMFVVTRTDLINDDLGALTALPRRIGRGGALKLNKVFWAAFLANGSFFTSDRGNYAEGAGTALGVDALTAAELLFLKQTDPDGAPLAVAPRILLVPPALLVEATQLMKSLEVRDTTASKKFGTSNPHAGKFEVEYSTYLSNANITGYSAKAWYLLAEPADVPVIEVAFLNGQQTPTVERADADFNVLGIQFRGYFDFGVALQEYRAGVKIKGEA